MPNTEPSTTATDPTSAGPSPVLVIAYGDDYHRGAAAALHAYAVVVAGTPMGATHIGWGASDAGARAVGEIDAGAWAAVLDALDDRDRAALNNAIPAIVTDTAFRVLGVAGIRGDLEMILRGYARSHELARDTCLYDHYHEVGRPCPRSAT